MTDAHEIADRYIALWNETDAGVRRAGIAGLWREDARYVDPLMEGSGHDEIDALITAVRQRFPGHRFARTGTAEAHHDALRFSWTLAADGGPTVAAGTDFGRLAPDGRLANVTGFLDYVATA